MSDPTERPAADRAGAPAATDADAWATACAEDLAAERARRRERYGVPPGSAAEELRRLAGAVTDKLASLQGPLAGMAAQGAVQQFVNRARAAVEPVVERNPDVFDHLAAAGSELLAAYRSAVESRERDWTRGANSPGGDAGKSGPASDSGDKKRTDGPEGCSGSEHIDLD
ncbi:MULTISPECIES: DUF5304 domain-containing protein [Streptomyces]|uniref:DUF5304 domain-containing protein n=1 Tax=Streptomyces lycii TaxID=2654337 RepID=A0ABQ7FFQ6_9ACTN|nr:MULTISPECIES: DUF5304 domain-containing protein [Streptomyces]KAF4406489.1 DUF5304 domain-containing protein [Streptomyces lycii]PGH50783.1 hypothetical protein CRI70_10295 [Streptomyces sp. Ru87]